MAWIYLAESEGSQSHLMNGSNQSRTVKTTDMHKESYSQECVNKNSLELLSGMTFELSTELNFEDKSILSAEAFHARTSVLLEMVKAWQESEAGFLQRSCAWPKKSSPSFYFLKMSQQLELEDLTMLANGWPVPGMIVAGILYPLRKLERLTSANAGFYLPTPTASDFGTSGNGIRKGKQKQIVSLGTMARKNHWPTPTVCGNNQNKKVGNTHLIGLATAVKMWPTPKASDWKQNGSPAELMRNSPGLGATICQGNGGQLSPMWVEWLMGYHSEWTALDASAIQWFRSKQKQRSKD